MIIMVKLWLISGPRYSIRAISGTTVAPNKDINEEKSPENWKIKMLYDGECPLCMREVYRFPLSLPPVTLLFFEILTM